MMFTKVARLAPLLATLLLFAPASSEAGVILKAFGTATATSIQTSNWRSNFDSKLGIAAGGGLGFEIPLSKYFHLEIDGVVAQHEFFENPGTVQVSWQSVQSPVLLRLVIAKDTRVGFSIGAGAFMDYAYGNLSYAGGPSTFFSYGLKHFNGGPIVSVEVNYAVSKTFGTFFEARYLYGIMNQSDLENGTVFKPRDIQALAGIKILLGK